MTSLETCPTVKVVANNEQGFIIVNESDVTPDMKIFGTVGTPASKASKMAKTVPEIAQVQPAPSAPQESAAAFQTPFVPAAEPVKMPWQQ